MTTFLLVGAAAVLLQELFHQVLDKIAWREPKELRIRAKNLVVRFFTIITFPLVLFMMLVAAIWLLPYLLLSKSYRTQLLKAHKEDTEADWHSVGTFSTQLSALSLPEFMLTPFRPVLSFMDWLGQKRTKRNHNHNAEQESSPTRISQ